MAYIGQNFNSDDLQTYLQYDRPDAVGYTIPVVSSTLVRYGYFLITTRLDEHRWSAQLQLPLWRRSCFRYSNRCWYHLPSPV